MSTTLATNALVEGQGGRIALVMIGFSETDLDKAGLRQVLGGDPAIFIDGGHGGKDEGQSFHGPTRVRRASGMRARGIIASRDLPTG